MSKSVPILMTGRPSAVVREGVASLFEPHVLIEAPDSDALLREIGSRIRGIAAATAPLGPDLLDRLPALEIIASFGVGYDHVDAVAAAERGIVVTNTPDVLTEEVADLAIGLLLATVRQLPQADAYLRAGRWVSEGAYPLGATLRERRIGILGLGRIGKAVARRLEAFGLEIAYHGRSRQPDVDYPFYADLTEMARAVDVLIVVAPGGAQTTGIVNAEVLEALGPQGILINVGRGTVVDEPALVTALREGIILSAGLDVFADEPRVPADLIACPNTVLLPHVGSASVHTRAAMGRLVVDNLKSWFEGRGPLTPVAETPWPRKG